MLEAHAHNHLKYLLQGDQEIWPHNLTLSRLIARSLRRRDKTLIQLPIGSQECWWPGLLIPLCLKDAPVVLVLSSKNRHRLFQRELPRLKTKGFSFSIWEGPYPPPENQVWLLEHQEFITAFKNGYLHSQQLIIPEAELLSGQLRDSMALEITHSDWEQLRRAHPVVDSALLEIYQRLTRRLFTYSTCEDAQVVIDTETVTSLRDLLGLLDSYPPIWIDFLNAINNNWASWGQLNHKMLDWHWHLQPLEPFACVRSLFIKCPVLMLTGSWQNDLLLSNLKAIDFDFTVSVQLGGRINQEPIPIFIPFRQPMPNTEFFADHLLDQSRRLILGLEGVTIIILNDDQLRQKLTSQLAAEFGRRVVHETTAPASNGVICCSCSWWLNYHQHLPAPEQLIFAILPFSSLESPLIAARVNAWKKQGRDWFRDLLLPEVLSVIPYIVEPVRRNQGRIAILDGRLRSRSWGKMVLRTFEPWTPLDRLLPN
tara:strand:+ start:3754 stop:5199 length:1446 start_codon:yes stop_codon:yes gene_type:complete